MAAHFIWTYSAHLTHREYAERRSDRYEDRANQRIAQECVGRDAHYLSDCAKQVIDSTRENQRGEHELRAQQEAADWTRGAALLSGFAVFISIVGLWTLFGTLKQGERTAEAAIRATDAAVAQQRPWLKFELIEAPEVWFAPAREGLPEGMVGARITGKVVNLGNTPATGVGIVPIVWATGENTGSGPHAQARKILRQKLSKRENFTGMYNLVLFPKDVHEFETSGSTLDQKIAGALDLKRSDNQMIDVTILIAVRYEFGRGETGITIVPVQIWGHHVAKGSEVDGSAKGVWHSTLGLVLFQTSVLKEGSYRPGEHYTVYPHWQGVEAE